MIDINLIRTNPELVKENIKKKFQDRKLPLVDEALALDSKRRALIAEGDQLRAARASSVILPWADSARRATSLDVLSGSSTTEPQDL